MKYLVVSGYFNKPESGMDWFYPIWWRNTIEADVKPQKVCIISMGGHTIKDAPGDWINLVGDTVDSNTHGVYPPKFPANQIVVCTGALLAWLNQCDLVYKEQDLLAFGPYIKQMYDEIGDRKMIYGRLKMPWAANSLCLFKWDWCLEFVRWFLGTETQTSATPHVSAEDKFFKFVQTNPELAGFYSFGYDRDRPFNITDKVWTAQKFTAKELILLREHGLISFDGEPPYKRQITNTRQHDVLE